MNCYTVVFVCRFSNRPSLVVRCRAETPVMAFGRVCQ